jgi:hypothetical protein
LVIVGPGALAIAQDRDNADSSGDGSEYIRIAREKTATLRIEDVETGAEIERVENPVFRYTEQVRGPAQGLVWVWGRKGRPAAVLEMIRREDEDWYCFHATSDKPIKLSARTGQVWKPKSSDLRFQALPGAPAPADLPSQRLRQMKEFVQRFTAHEFFTDGRHEMRILPAPVHRYEDDDQGLMDGAIFLIAIGTHPEATLFVEATRRDDAAQPIWKFAVGRSGAAEMVISYDDKEVHHLPLIEAFPPSTNSYWRMMLKGDQK